MSKGDRVPEEIKSFLRSVLISSNGVKQSRVQKDYHELAGERLMWKNYGFSSLNEFLKALPDVCMLQYSPKDKENRVYAVQKEGTYMSSHAKKNAKVASSSISPITETNLAENGRIVQNDGEKIRVTVANTPLNTSSESESSDLLPNSDGLYQVYVVKLPEKCTETELRNCFQIYGKVVECQVVRSSIGKKIGFIRYSLKNEAQLALTEGRRNPPKIFGVTLEVGKTKKKSNDNIETSVNAALNSEPSEGSISSFSSSTPSSPIKSNASPTALQDQQAKNNLPTAPQFPTYRPMNTQSNSPQTTGNNQPYLAENPPHNTQTPLSVQLPPTQLANTGNNGPWILDPNSTTKTLLSLQPVSETRTTSKEPTNTVSKPLEKVDNRLNYSLVISGYDRKLTEANIKQVFQNVHDLQRIEYQPHHSIAWFKTKDASLHAVNELNGKYCNGCVLLVKPLTKHPSDMDEVEPVRIVNEEKLPVEFQDEFTKIYDFFSEAISGCCRQDYLHWLNNLPSIFEVKIMDLIDPCTFWVHLSDGTNAYRDFNELTHQLSLIKPSSGLSCLKNNEFGAGQFSDDGLWYRCYCREASTDGRLLHVIYIDYGNTEWLERQRTVKLNDSYFKLRPQGILVKLSGFRFKSSNNSELDSKLLSTAKNLLMFKCFQARRGSVDSSKPFLLEIELLQSKGESVLSELESLSGVETRQKESSPPPPLLLSGQPPVPTIVKPPKDTFSSVDSEIHYVWITNIKSPTTFNFQLVNSSSREAIKRIQEMLLKCNIQNKVNVKDPKISNLVCYHKNGLERSRVTFISSTGTPGKVTVLHVDTGKVAVVPLMSFIALPQEAKDIPYQGRPAILYRVPQDPLAKSAKALEFIIQQATEVLQAIIVNENKDGSVYVELFNAGGASINKTLIEMANTERELSKATPPSEVSRQNRKISTEALHNGDQSDPKSMTPSSQCDGGEAVFSSGAPIQSQSAISPSGSSRAPQSQSQVSSRRGELERGHVSPGNQASARVMQGLSNQTPTQSAPRPKQEPVQKQATHVRPSTSVGNQGFEKGVVTTPNQASTYNQAPVTKNQAFGHSQANQAFGHSQAPPQSHENPSGNQAFSRRPAAVQNQSSNQAPPQNQASPQNQAPPQNRVSPNPAFERKPALNQVPHNLPPVHNLTPRNQGLSQRQPSPPSTTQAFASKQASPQGKVAPRQPSPTQAFGKGSANQPMIQTRPQPSQAHSRVLTYQMPQDQTAPQKQAPPHGQAPLQNQVVPKRQGPPQDQAASRKQAPPQDQAPFHGQAPLQNQVAPKRQGPPQDQAASRKQAPPRDQAPSHSQTPPQNQVLNPAANLGRPAPTHGPSPPNRMPNEQSSLKNMNMTSSAMTSQRVPSQGHNAFLPTGQFVSQNPTSQKSPSQATTSRAGTSQGMTSQSMTSQCITSQTVSSPGPSVQNLTSKGITSKGVASHVTSHDVTSRPSEAMTSQYLTSSLAEAGKPRSDSSASSGSKNSSSLDENFDEPLANVERDTTNSSKSSLSNQKQSNKSSRSPKKQSRNEMAGIASKGGQKIENSANIGSAGGKISLTAEAKTRSFSGRGGAKALRQNFDRGSASAVDEKTFRDLTTKFQAQQKILASTGKDLRMAAEMYMNRQKLNLTYKIKMLENENLILEAEIKKNLQEKSELEKKLQMK